MHHFNGNSQHRDAIKPFTVQQLYIDHWMVYGNTTYFKTPILPIIAGMHGKVIILYKYSFNYVFKIIYIETNFRVCPFKSLLCDILLQTSTNDSGYFHDCVWFLSDVALLLFNIYKKVSFTKLFLSMKRSYIPFRLYQKRWLWRHVKRQTIKDQTHTGNYQETWIWFSKQCHKIN